jgi:hypothetical protein
MTAPETADLIERLEKRLEAPGLIVALTKDEARDLLSAALASDHIGNSTTMVPALGVEGVAQIIADANDLLSRWLAQSCEDDDVPELQASTRAFVKAARAIIAAMEKNYG